MKNWFQKLKYKTASFLYGRYGNDELTKFLLIAALVLMLLSLIPHLGWIYFLAQHCWFGH